MKDLRKFGGIAALIEAGTFIVGFALLFALLVPAGYGTGELDTSESVAFAVNNRAILHIWNLIIYVIFGIFLVVLSLALHDRLKPASPLFASTATAFGLIWAGLVIASGMVANIGLGNIVELAGDNPAQAASLWLAVESIQDGLGGGNEIVGGIWVLLISWSALRANVFSKALNYLGLVIGLAGIITIIPVLEILGAVFGFGLIVWFVWVGITMLRQVPALES